MPDTNYVANYAARITRILPTEFVGAYLTVTQVVRHNLDFRQPALLLSLFVCLFLIPTFLTRIKGINNRQHHRVVQISFLVWVYALGDLFQPGRLLPYDLYHPELGTVLLVLWGLVPLVLHIEPHAEVQDNGS